MANLKRYWFVFFVLFLFGLSYWTHDEPVDWRETYSPEDKIPYGTFLLFNQLPQLFDEDKISRNDRPFSEWLEQAGSGNNLILIGNQDEFGEVDQELLLQFAYRGNHVFIANQNISKTFYEELNLVNKIDFVWNTDTSTNLVLVNPKFRSDTARFTNLQSHVRLIPGDDFNGKVLGIHGDEKRADFVKIPYGIGFIYIHLTPQVFTNIHFLENPRYVARCLSYLPKQETIWDDYYQPYFRSEEKGGNFQYIQNHPALWNAWLLFLIGCVLAFFFYAKRRQRAIPYMPLPENRSLEFIETIGDLYFQEGNHYDVAKKKIRYFYHNVALMFLLHENHPEFWSVLQQKSGAQEKTINQLKEMIVSMEKFTKISPNFLLRLNKHLEEFYAQTGKYPYHE